MVVRKRKLSDVANMSLDSVKVMSLKELCELKIDIESLTGKRFIKHLNSLYRKDNLVNELCQSIGNEYDVFVEDKEDLINQYDLDKVTWGITLWESLLKIKADATQPIENRRSVVKAKWQSDGKIDEKYLQRICDSWKNGEVEVDYDDGIILLRFIGSVGVPEDLDGLLRMVSDVKPAHLLLEYVLKYLLIRDITQMKIAELSTKQINNFAFNKKG